MNNYTLHKGSDKVSFKCPSGRHEVTYDKWSKAYEYTKFIEEIKEEENEFKAAKLTLEYMCRMIAALSDGISYDELLQCNHEQINNIFRISFDWLQNEQPKRRFKVNGKNFEIPNYERRSSGEFMDAMDLINAMQTDDFAFMGCELAAVYLHEEGFDSSADRFEKIEERKEFFKQYGRMDLFYSVGFFFAQFNESLPARYPAAFSGGNGKANKHLERLGYLPLFRNVAKEGTLINPMCNMTALDQVLNTELCEVLGEAEVMAAEAMNLK